MIAQIVDQSTKQKVINLRGKYIKQALTQLERINGGMIKQEERKAVLDAMNDLVRDVLIALGATEEAQ
jgi:hypothetical protein